MVHGTDGLDELSISAPTQVWEVHNNGIEEYTVTPEELGLPRASKEAIKGGDPQANAATLRALLSGQDGALRDIVALNAAAALVAGDKAADLQSGVALAKAHMDDGSALKQVDALITASQQA